MKKLLTYLLVFLFTLTAAHGAKNVRIFYIDFGSNDGKNGNATIGPDKNGHHWNNVTDPKPSASPVKLVDLNNDATNAILTIDAGFSANGVLNGGLTEPENALLKDLAIPTVTGDYFFTSTISSFTIKGLDPSKGYVLSFFGSRSDTEKRISAFTASGINRQRVYLQTSGSNLGSGDFHGNIKTIATTKTVVPDNDGQICVSLAKIEGENAYLSCMRIKEVQASAVDTFWKKKEPLHIAFMGSSVAYGTGAAKNLGYAYFFKQLLNNRWKQKTGKNWNVTNISIGGNTTNNLLKRWDNDLLPLCSRYVIYGLSLGNEGIVQGGQATFNQFRDNLQLLIKKAREKGIEPVVVNCYTRSDYKDKEYEFVKQMNLLMHQWDVASINVLGAIDDGSGKWATGYRFDDSHPNTGGHREFAYSIVPSLFDAMDAGKPQPSMVEGTSLCLKTKHQLQFTAEETLHPFTLSFDVQTEGTGALAHFKTTTGQNILTLEKNGSLTYQSPLSSGIQGQKVLNDKQWHKVTLTHYYAMGKTFLYVDKELQGVVDEKLEASQFNLGGRSAPTANYRKLLFYRSGMNELEVAALNNNMLLKSSLEIFAPLDEMKIFSKNPLVNLAQSTNKVVLVKNP